MFENFVKVIIFIKQCNIQNVILVDNIKEDISFNNKFNNLSKEKYQEFLISFFRIIREWKLDETEDKIGSEVYIKIIEKEKQYNLYVDKDIPNNFDSFLDLIYSLV